MKKYLLAFSIFIIIAVLAGCGSESSSKQGGASSLGGDDNITITRDSDEQHVLESIQIPAENP